MTYQPTPAGLQRDLKSILYVLAIALANLDRLHPKAST